MLVPPLHVPVFAWLLLAPAAAGSSSPARNPEMDAASYDFVAQFSVPLLPAVPNVVDLIEGIPGVSGSNDHHWLLVRNCSSGRDEAVLISGGTATPERAGTLIFTPSRSCERGWYLTSASGGLAEALHSAPRPAVVFAPSVVTVYGTVTPPTGSSIRCAGAGTMSSNDGAPCTLLFSPSVNGTALFNVVNDHVSIRDFRLEADTDAFVPMPGNAAVHALQRGVGSAASILLENLDIYGFFNGLVLDGTANSVVNNIQVANTASDGFVSKQAQGYWSNMQAINCGGHGLVLAEATYAHGVQPFMKSMQVFNTVSLSLCRSVALSLCCFIPLLYCCRCSIVEAGVFTRLRVASSLSTFTSTM